MLKLTVLAFVLVIGSTKGLPIISRSEWGAAPPKWTTNMRSKADYVIIHHTASSKVCSTFDECKADLLNIQKDHKNNRKWSDIGYNFAIGGDGSVYEARGFGKQGSHAPGYNNKSIGIVLMGNFENTSPPSNMLQKAKDLIAEAVSQGKLDSNYTLYGHRQVKSTACPGKHLYDEIKTWSHWKQN